VTQRQVLDPRTGEVERLLAPPAPHELSACCERLRSAQPEWERSGVRARATALRRWADVLAADQAVLDALCRDTGRLRESVLERDQVVGMLRRWADDAPVLLDPGPGRTSAVARISVQQQLRAYPLVGVISPWNFPLLLGLIDAVPALAAGCAVVVKPSEVTPRFVAPLARALEQVPELSAVLAVVEGDGSTGAALVEQVDLVCFTGSVPTGRLVAEAAARAFVPAFLELGGKDPAVVLADADLDRASSALVWGGMANAGQSCLSVERVYVEEPAHDELVDRLVDKASRLRFAWPDPTDGEIGPVIDPQQADVLQRHLCDALASGAAAPCGGALRRLGGGWWCEPTVLTGVDHSMLVMTEETFGPVLPVMPVRDVEQAVALANDSAYGLSGAVFAGSERRALAVAERLDAGAVSVNDAALTAIVRDGEKHSFKGSGLGGSRMGPAALLRFVRKKALLVNGSPAADPWWFDSKAGG
jgi:aldehyde dehydrogenase (NAD+)